jgi:hypothetical protein
MGVTDFTQKGEDYVTNPATILLPQVHVDVPNSTVISFFGAASYSVTGVSFAPTDANDVEQTEFVVTASGKPSVRIALLTHASAARGFYQKGVSITGTSPTPITTVGFSVVLAPKLAGDEAQHAAWTFSELNQDSPYAGKTRLRRRAQWLLRFVTSSGMETVPIFTGLTSTPSGSSNRTAIIKALDNRETMINTGQGLNIVAEYPVSQDLWSGQSLPTMPGLESTWIISRLFFLAFYRTRAQVSGVFTYESQFPTFTGLGYFSSPLASQYASVWATMHGSAHALDIAANPIQYAYTEFANHTLRRRVAFEVGPFVAATRNEPVGISTYMSWQVDTWVSWSPSTRQIVGRLQCWIRRNQVTSTLKVDLPDNNGNIYDAWVEITSVGVVRFRVEAPSISRTITGPTITADATWHFLGVHYDSIVGSVIFRVDSANTTVAMTTWSNTSITIVSHTVNLTLTDGMQIAEFQVDGGHEFGGGLVGITSTEAWANENFIPTAFVDKSENLLDVMPVVDVNADSFNVASDIAIAEFAALFFDSDGYPHFRTSRSDASITGQTIQRQITSRKSIKQIAYESGVLQVRNIVSAQYMPYVASISTEIFSASGVISLFPGQSLRFTVTLQGPIISIGTITYTAFSQSNGTGTNLTSQVSVVADTNTPGQVIVTVTNDSGSTAYIVDNTGQPNLHVKATFMAPLQDVNSSTVTYSDADSVRKFGEQSLPASGASTWIQREDSAASIALKLLSDLCQPHPVIMNLSIKGDPTLEFGDLVTIIDINTLGVNGQYRITGKNPLLSPSNGFTQDLVVRSAPSIAYWDVNFWDDGTVWG